MKDWIIDKGVWVINAILVLFLVFLGLEGSAQDSTGRGPRHYFNTTIWGSWYSSNLYDITSPKLDSLGKYSFAQSHIAFYAPLYTKDIPKKEGTVIANRHLLLTGSLLNAKPGFSALAEQHQLYKSSLGFRYIYNNGEKNIWFFDLSSYITGDATLKTGGEFRSSSVLVFNRTVNEKFSYKIGYTKTFLFGDRLYLPVLGVRIGRLDGIYANICFPRTVSLNFPLGSKLSGSVFVKPMGGIYNFANSIKYENGIDTTLYNGFSSDSNYIIFARYEYLGGMRLDYTPGRHFSFFVSGGITVGNWMGFASYQNNNKKEGFKRIEPFAGQRFTSSNSFFNFGLTIRLGRTKKIAGNTQMYEVLNTNNLFDPGDNNTDPGNGNIPKKKKEKDLKKLSYKDIEDFVEDGEL